MLAYRCDGDSQRPVLVLLHGLLGDKDDWQAILPSLSHHFCCIALDLPGHGASPALEDDPGSSGFQRVVTHILSTLDELKVNRFHLLGYSLGGRIALHLAQHLAKRAPERLLSLHLESCHPGLSNDEERAQRLEQDRRWQQKLLSLPITDFLALWYRQGVFASLSDMQRQRLIQKRAHNSPEALASIYLPTSLGQQADLAQLPSEQALPWHYYVGLQDNKFLALASAWQARQGISLTKLPGSGHNVHLAQPEAFCDALIANLRIQA
ncbi:2-succinyl-6-hydroxy-2,4-cyclohexadiene-1-carboxylate synthase [Shewanella alkalitolerans]|uniref:2-succinyl-6-hydroxy-2, 4-cyclohexadiene-1-carboxylate synthase n=1 Tax=Shewanella alkalitolerans TaxID=2864209 RepID=UPI001C65ABA4|nr:2-succinyl-6-hydroxy-2,4-cyclohexadiene-1-carboxylate synthase [Shewanella alkalitolerans]QYJ97458.1 2-succinyl-6-hydroxy-2,4-cyclohexadiene-1-carboxylate synthase [Shewanella alkalitolerans]